MPGTCESNLPKNAMLSQTQNVIKIKKDKEAERKTKRIEGNRWKENNLFNNILSNTLMVKTICVSAPIGPKLVNIKLTYMVPNYIVVGVQASKKLTSLHGMKGIQVAIRLEKVEIQ
jgi:hypothetical protein